MLLSVIHYLVYGIVNLCPQYLTELSDENEWLQIEIKRLQKIVAELSLLG